ncbi:TMEM175 family protein [Dyella sp.]|uniref:TMEM175 family protein n=1 Tax=Dyella sp. TaxID=1869338 RepID=UPI002ED5C743
MKARTDQPVEDRHLAQRHLDRMVMLSDGIFAIAITLSAIELKPQMGDGKTLWQAWSVPLLVYFISFFIIGQLWLMHRRMLAHLRDIDSVGAAINLLLLSLVSLMPVIIRFALTEGRGNESTQVYALGLAVTYAWMGVLWGYLAFIAKLAPDVSRGLALSWLYRTFFIVLAFLAVMFYASGLRALGMTCLGAGLVLRIMSARSGREEKPAAQAAGE